MKKAIVTAMVVGLTISFACRAFADEKTIVGEGMCAKCVLKETKSCQNVIKVKTGDKTVTYYLEDNQVSKDFHDTICKKSAKVKATGSVKEVDGKMELAASKIELVND
jgi:hypothetical protein